MFNVGIIIITFKLLFIRSNIFSLKLFISNYWYFFVFYIFFEFSLFCHFFPNKNYQVRKF
jgi:hypothetical protein